MYRTMMAVFAVATALLVANSSLAADKGEKGNGTTIATVNGVAITAGQLKRSMDLAPDYVDMKNPKVKEILTNELVTTELAYQQAVKQGFDKDADIAGTLELLRKKLIAARFLRKESAGGVAVTDAEVRKFYDDNKDKFVRPERVRVAQIVVPDKEKADAASKELAAGKAFADVASRLSVDNSKAAGGDVGFIAKGERHPLYEKAAFSLDAGKASQPFMIDGAYFILSVIEKDAGGQLKYEDVAEGVRARMLAEKRQKAQQEYVRGLASKAEIKVDREAIQKVE